MRIVPLGPHTQGGEGPEGRGYVLLGPHMHGGGEGPEGRGYVLLGPHMHGGGEGPGDEATYSLPLICMPWDLVPRSFGLGNKAILVHIPR